MPNTTKEEASEEFEQLMVKAVAVRKYMEGE
jgi:hypothetical protein